MKKTLVFLVALLLAAGVAAQNPTTYFMEGSIFRQQFNPAFAPLRGYVNLPLAGNIHVGLNMPLPANKIFYPQGGKLVTLLDSSILPDQALQGVQANNLLKLELRDNIIGFGKFTKNHKNFWSFDINLHTNLELNLPGSFFEFIKRGQEGSIRNLGTSADLYLDAGFAYSFPLLGDKLYIGAKAKFLLGVARMKLNFERFDVTMQDDRWAVESLTSIEANILGNTNPKYTYDQNGTPYFEIGDLFNINKFQPAGYGFAVDLGATYDILHNLQVSLAVTDLGFISWSKGGSCYGESQSYTEYTGVIVEGGQVPESPNFSFEEIMRFRPTNPQSTTRMLRASLNAGIAYWLWQHRISLGAFYQMRLWEYKNLHSITGSVNFSPARWFTLSGSYTLQGRYGSTVGVGMNICPNWINFFIGTDVLVAKHTTQWIPIDRSSMNFTFGLGFPIGKRSRRIEEYIRVGDR